MFILRWKKLPLGVNLSPNRAASKPTNAQDDDLELKDPKV
jgi:hypothetical protein